MKVTKKGLKEETVKYISKVTKKGGNSTAKQLLKKGEEHAKR